MLQKQPVLLKNVKTMKGKERLNNYSRLKETKTTWQWAAKYGLGLDIRFKEKKEKATKAIIGTMVKL